MGPSCTSMFLCNELMKYTLLQLNHEECSPITDCFENKLLTRDALAKLRKATICCVISAYLCVRPHGITGLSPAGFSCNMIFEYSSKICREISSFIDI
jgi:hypothetical protein